MVFGSTCVFLVGVFRSTVCVYICVFFGVDSVVLIVCVDVDRYV